MKIAFVVQRYGLEVNGGAELHCRLFAEKLAERGFDVDVLTTCAKDYLTWKNEYKEGVELINGVKVRRFKTDYERKLIPFHILSRKVLEKKHSLNQEIDWIIKQGPYTPDLIDYLTGNHEEYKKIIFFTYLYFPTVFGVHIAPKKTILIPTAHDEPAIYLNVYKSVFNTPNQIIYNTDTGKEFVQNQFNNFDIKSHVLGIGIEPPKKIKKPNINYPYIIYAGRIEEPKGCVQLINFFKKYKKENNNKVKLVFIGKSFIKIPRDKDIIHKGFVSEKEKWSLIKNAKILVLPSRYESFSMSTFEAWSLGVPTIVNEDCEVLKENTLKSNAGLYYSSYAEFNEALKLLLKNNKLRKELSKNGIEYVKKYYSWKKIITKLSSIIKS